MPRIECKDGLCVAIVPDEQLSKGLLEIGDDDDLERIKVQLVAHMEEWRSHSGIMLLGPVAATHRVGAKPERWLAEGVSVEFSESDDLEGEARVLLQEYSDMVREAAAAFETVETYPSSF
jgi:hypothetical protein